MLRRLRYFYNITLQDWWYAIITCPRTIRVNFVYGTQTERCCRKRFHRGECDF